MKRKLLIALIAVLVAATGVFTAVVLTSKHAQPMTATAQSIHLNADTIYRLVNDERMKAGLQPLIRDARLDASAQVKSDAMVSQNYFGHFNPATNEFDGSINKMNPGLCSYASENISEMVDPSGDNNTETVSSWMDSKPHHDAILDARYTHTGVAVSGNKVTQHFCVAR